MLKTPLRRRDFCWQTSLVMSASLSPLTLSAAGLPIRKRTPSESPWTSIPAGPVQQSVGLVTDLHYADKPPAGSRHYRATLQKIREAAGAFQQTELDALIELGDLIDSADTLEREFAHLRTIDQELSKIHATRHYVLGNHCVHTLRKSEFLSTVKQARSFYSFDLSPCHCIVLDACFRSDGQPYERGNFQWTDPNIPRDQLDWLHEDLKRTNLPTLVFVHQRLDVEGAYAIKNAPRIRTVLEQSQKVVAVFQGHSHKNDYRQVGKIHYCTLVAMVEGGETSSNGYSLLEMDEHANLRLKGFRRQASHQWPAPNKRLP